MQMHSYLVQEFVVSLAYICESQDKGVLTKLFCSYQLYLVRPNSMAMGKIQQSALLKEVDQSCKNVG